MFNWRNKITLPYLTLNKNCQEKNTTIARHIKNTNTPSTASLDEEQYILGVTVVVPPGFGTVSKG